MKKEKKLHLSEIEVQSFVTSLEKDDQKSINGGFAEALPGGASNPVNCRRTSIPVLC